MKEAIDNSECLPSSTCVAGHYVYRADDNSNDCHMQENIGVHVHCSRMMVKLSLSSSKEDN